MSIDLRLGDFTRNGDRQSRNPANVGFKLQTGVSNGTLISSASRAIAINNTVGTPWNPTDGGGLYTQTISISEVSTAVVKPETLASWTYASALRYEDEDNETINYYIKIPCADVYGIGTIICEAQLSGHLCYPMAAIVNDTWYDLDCKNWGTAGKWMPQHEVTVDDVTTTEYYDMPNFTIRTGSASQVQHSLIAANSTGKTQYVIIKVEVPEDTAATVLETYPNAKFTIAYTGCKTITQQWGTMFSTAQSMTQVLLNLRDVASTKLDKSLVGDDSVNTWYRVGETIIYNCPTQSAGTHYVKWSGGNESHSGYIYRTFTLCVTPSCTITVSAKPDAPTISYGGNTYTTDAAFTVSAAFRPSYTATELGYVAGSNSTPTTGSYINASSFSITGISYNYDDTTGFLTYNATITVNYNAYIKTSTMTIGPSSGSFSESYTNLQSDIRTNATTTNAVEVYAANSTYAAAVRDIRDYPTKIAAKINSGTTTDIPMLVSLE